MPGLGPTPIPVYLTLLVSMFMHGGIAHIAGNMLYLFIFGDNVEDRIGRVRFLLFYLCCGVAASLAHVFVSLGTGRDLGLPSLGLGASEASASAARSMAVPPAIVVVGASSRSANGPSSATQGRCPATS